VDEKLSGRYVPNGRLFYAKLGSKSGGKRSLRMLPEPSDLEGQGWELRDEQTWRTGRMGRVTEWSLRARQAGSVTAIRSFEQTDLARWVVAEVIPVTSEVDAVTAVGDLPNRFIGNPRSRGRVTSEGSVPDVTVADTLASWAYKQTITSDRGEGLSLLLGGAARSVVFVVIASALTDAWNWDEVQSVAAVIVRRIGAAFDAG
jgi:hypothetical protein